MESKHNWTELPFDIWLKISKFAVAVAYTISPEININRLDSFNLWEHPKAIDIAIASLSHTSDITNFYEIVDGLHMNPNPRAALLLLKSPSQINWASLSIASINLSLWAEEFILSYYDQYHMLQKNSFKTSLTNLCNSSNPKLLELLSRYPKYIDGDILSGNTSPHAIILLRRLPHFICWYILSGNSCPQAVELLSENIHNIDWDAFSANECPQAIELMSLYPNEINWLIFSTNKCLQAFELMEIHLDKVSKFMISRNKSLYAITFMSKHPEFIDWNSFSLNRLPQAVEVSKLYNENIYWMQLSAVDTPEAMQLLSANPDKIRWSNLVKCRCPQAIELIVANIDNIIENHRFCNFALICDISHPKIVEILAVHSPGFISKNPDSTAIDFLKLYPEYISCQYLRDNPNSESVELLSLIENITQQDLKYLSKTKNSHIVRYVCKHNLFPGLQFKNVLDEYFVTDISSFDRKKQFLYTFNIREK